MSFFMNIGRKFTILLFFCFSIGFFNEIDALFKPINALGSIFDWKKKKNKNLLISKPGYLVVSGLAIGIGALAFWLYRKNGGGYDRFIGPETVESSNNKPDFLSTNAHTSWMYDFPSFCVRTREESNPVRSKTVTLTATIAPNPDKKNDDSAKSSISKSGAPIKDNEKNYSDKGNKLPGENKQSVDNKFPAENKLPGDKKLSGEREPAVKGPISPQNVDVIAEIIKSVGPKGKYASCDSKKPIAGEAIGVTIKCGLINVKEALFNKRENIAPEAKNNSFDNPDDKWEKLRTACIDGRLDACRKYIRSGVGVNKVDKDGKTVLHSAALHGNLEIVELLIAIGAEVDKPDNKGSTPILLFMEKYFDSRYCKEYYNTQLLEYLINHGADVNKGDNFDEAPIHLCARHGDIDIIKFMLGKNANINLKTKYGMTPLHYVFTRNHRHSLLNFMIENGAIVDEPDTLDQTPLHFCSMNGSAEDAGLFLDNGADIQKANFLGHTPLHYALLYNNLDVVKVLVERGADVNAVDNSGRSCLDLAIEKCDKDFLSSVFNISGENLDKDFDLHDLDALPENNCSICLESLKNKAAILSNGMPCKTGCGHYFHKDCINGWLLENETCPNCRAKQQKNFY